MTGPEKVTVGTTSQLVVTVTSSTEGAGISAAHSTISSVGQEIPIEELLIVKT